MRIEEQPMSKKRAAAIWCVLLLGAAYVGSLVLGAALIWSGRVSILEVVAYAIKNKSSKAKNPPRDANGYEQESKRSKVTDVSAER
jgi:hypothetical protein